jgi:hyperosmotically inducible periplasmic protein
MIIMRNINSRAPFIAVLALLTLAPLGSFAQSTPQGPAQPLGSEAALEQRVRHALVMLPYYNVFDNLEFQVDGGHVTLAGEVTWPVLKSDAASAVKRVEGVQEVTNNIEVLPLSRFDDQIRRATYRAVFGADGLYRYAMGANPSIHIIVDNGHVTLVGVVGTQMDKSIAGIRANSVPGVFSVTNNLRVAS